MTEFNWTSQREPMPIEAASASQYDVLQKRMLAELDRQEQNRMKQEIADNRQAAVQRRRELPYEDPLQYAYLDKAISENMPEFNWLRIYMGDELFFAPVVFYMRQINWAWIAMPPQSTDELLVFLGVLLVNHDLWYYGSFEVQILLSAILQRESQGSSVLTRLVRMIQPGGAIDISAELRGQVLNVINKGESLVAPGGVLKYFNFKKGI